MAPVPTSLSRHPLKASEGLEALATVCITVTPRRPRLDDAWGDETLVFDIFSMVNFTCAVDLAWRAP